MTRRKQKQAARRISWVDVMRQCLNLSNGSCVESALHGLGHLRSCYPEAAGIVRHVLNTTQRTDPDLLRYTDSSPRWLVLAQTNRLGNSAIFKVTQGITTNQWPR